MPDAVDVGGASGAPAAQGGGGEEKIVKYDSAFPSKYIKSSDLNGQRFDLVIDLVQMETMGNDSKLVVYFAGKKKGLALNKTNANMIAEIAGTDETDNWRGVKITLYGAKVEYQGKRVDGIRVDWPQDAQRAPGGNTGGQDNTF